MVSPRFLFGAGVLFHVLLAPSTAVAQTNSKPQILTGEIAFTKQVIDDVLDQNYAVVGADFDGDSDLDAASADYVNGHVLWYENDGSGRFQRRMVDANLAGAYPVGAGDVDLDGDPDILVGGYNADLFVWYENDGRAGFTRRIVGASDGPHSIVAVDLDRDGDNDFVTSSQDADNVAWYENDGHQNFTPHILTVTTNGAKRAEPADLDGDGDWDILSASFFSYTVIWHENDGNQNFTMRILDANLAGAYYVESADLDGDGDLDVMAAGSLSNDIPWYQNNGANGFTKRFVDPNAVGARSVMSADVDGDGDLDALGASVGDDTVAWHENDGRGNFTQRTIDRLTDGAYGVTPIDMDRDGDIDVLSSARDAKEVSLHTQIKRHAVMVGQGATLVFSDALLLTIDREHLPHQLIYSVTDAPDTGTLRLNGSPIPIGGTFTQADVNNGRLAYVHGGASIAPDRFAFAVRDTGPGASPPAGGEVDLVVWGRGVVELTLNEGTGTTAFDASGTGNHGRLVNGPAYDANTPDRSSYSLRFDGTNDFIDLGVIDPNGSGLTLAAWMNVDQFTGFWRNGSVISKASSTALNNHVFLLSMSRVDQVTTRLVGMVRVGGTSTRLVASSGDLETGRWYHVALTHDGIALRLFLDGILVGETPLAGRMDVDPTKSVAVGGQPPGAGSAEYFDGLLDDVRILRRVMTQSEIARLASGCAGRFSTYGAGLAGSGGYIPRFLGSGCPTLGENISLDITRGLGGAPGIAILSIARASLPFLGGTLLVQPSVSIGVVLSGSGAGNGASSLPFRVPVQFGLSGSSVLVQGLFFDPAAPMGFSFTPGLDVSIGG